jgi:hypothetical protein
MYYIIKLAPLVLLQSLVTILTNTETNLKRINFHDQYKVDGYRSKDYEVVKSLDSNRMGAAELCSKSGHELFLVRPNTILMRFFQSIV